VEEARQHSAVSWSSAKRAYVAIRLGSFLCIGVAVVAAVFNGPPSVAGTFLLTGVMLIGMAGILNLYKALADQRMFVGSREVSKESHTPSFRLWVLLNAFAVLLSVLALIAVAMVNYL
jgi:hypothetical protein